jgi:hypothetical protein
MPAFMGAQNLTTSTPGASAPGQTVSPFLGLQILLAMANKKRYNAKDYSAERLKAQSAQAETGRIFENLALGNQPLGIQPRSGPVYLVTKE